MLTDGREVETGTRKRAEVCVIGSGPAGLPLALALAEQGIGVCLVESGGLDPDPDAQVLAKGENAGHTYYDLDACRIRGVGGSANAWDVPANGHNEHARLAPLRPIDLEHRDWVPHSGWPFSFEVLEPWYRRAHEALAIGPFAYTPEDNPPPPTFRSLELPGAAFSTAIFRLVSSRRLTHELRQRAAAHTHIDLVHHANAIAIDTDDEGHRATTLDVGTMRGNRFTVEAKAFVLAAGGIDNARLLLVSDRVHRTGLGNHNDLVGRFFMEHPHVVAGLVVPRDAAMLREPGFSDVYLVDDVPVYRGHELTEEALRRERLPAFGFRFAPEPWTSTARRLAALPDSEGIVSLRAVALALRRRRGVPGGIPKHVARVFAHLDDVARLGIRRVRRNDGSHTVAGDGVFTLYAMSEQIPDPSSRVVLSDRVDALGERLLDPRCRQPKLVWQLTEGDERTLLTAQRLLRKVLRAAGIGEVHLRLFPGGTLGSVHGGYHHMGTTRMHADPRHGVVDARCRLHSVRNLFIAGSSVFPTTGYVNPTLTIVALALRTANDIARILRTSPVVPKTEQQLHESGEAHGDTTR